MSRHLPRLAAAPRLATAIGLNAALTLTAVVAVVAPAAQAQVQSQTQLKELSAPLPAPDFNLYGRALAMDDGWAAIGLQDSGPSGGGQGAVELYEWSGGAWVFRQKLVPNDPHALTFGRGLALRDGVLAVGDTADDEAGADAGAVHLFKLSGSTWVFKDKLLNPDPPTQESFGLSLATFGNVLVVGHQFGEAVTGSGVLTGAAYVYRRNPSDVWNFEAKLTGAGTGHNDQFGRAVALHNTLIVVGSTNFGSGGRAYVTRRSGGAWVPDGFIQAPSSASGDLFGWSVALEGTRVVVGAEGLPLSGAVHVFEDDGADLDFVETLTAPGAADGDGVGFSVDLDGDLLVASAPYVSSPGSPAAAAFVWRHTGGAFAPDRWLRTSDPAAEDEMWLVAVDGNHVLGSVLMHDHGAPGVKNKGAVYAFLLNWDDLGFGLAGSSGVPSLEGKGSLAAGAGITLISTGSPAATIGYLFVGFDRIDAPFKGGVVVPAFVPPLGMMLPFSTGFVGVSSQWPAALPAGFEVFLQVWMAEPGTPTGVCASNAVRGFVVP